MKNGLLSKILGWTFFGIQAVAQVTANGIPHGFVQWTQLAAALLGAVAIHAASNVGQVVKQPTATSYMTTSPTGATQHIMQ